MIEQTLKKERIMLSETKYAGLCVLGMEVFYVLCLAYGLLISGKRGNYISRCLNFCRALSGEIR